MIKSNVGKPLAFAIDIQGASLKSYQEINKLIARLKTTALARFSHSTSSRDGSRVCYDSFSRPRSAQA